MSEENFELIDKYWRAANYLSVGQIYLYDNPLLKKPITASTSSRGSWATGARRPGLNFIYVHLNRIIRERRLKMIYIAGPGHGGPASSPMPTSRGPTAKSTRTSRRAKRG